MVKSNKQIKNDVLKARKIVQNIYKDDERLKDSNALKDSGIARESDIVFKVVLRYLINKEGENV